MIRTYLKISAGELLCGGTMIITTLLMFLFLPNEPVDWRDFLYLSILLLTIFTGFTAAGCITFAKRYRRLYHIPDDYPALKAALPGDPSGYSLLMTKIYRIMEDRMRQEMSLQQAAAREKNDYIEQWVHDAKIALAVCELILTDEQVSDQDNLMDIESLTFELERLKYMMNQVLYSARVADLAQNLSLSCFSVKNALRKIIKTNAMFFIRNNLNLSLDMEDETVTTEEKWLSYICTQILHNAAKYSEAGSTVRICSEHSAGELMLHIRNEGKGIRQEDLPKIFDKGYVGEEGQAQTKSTGIGLYLAKRAAGYLGGDIRVRSVPGCFAEFTVVLPAQRTNGS